MDKKEKKVVKIDPQISTKTGKKALTWTAKVLNDLDEKIKKHYSKNEKNET